MEFRKKILIVSYDFCLESGGIENSGYLFAKYLAEYADVSTFCLANGNSPNIQGIHEYQSRYTKHNRTFFELAKLIKKNKFDYILCMTYTCARNIFLLKFFFSFNYGVLGHGNEVLPIPLTGYHTARMKVKRRLIFNFATHVFANTFFTKGLIKKFSNNKNIFVINPPISFFPVEENLTSKVHVMLSICRLVERKGCQNVIKAMPQILKTYPNMKYIICGKGDYEKELRLLVSNLKLENNVFFKGRVSEEEKDLLLRNCGLFILPSVYLPSDRSVEGFGISLVEASAYGKFVVSSRSGGISEAVISNKTGFLVEENNIQEISNAVLHFYDDDFHYDPSVCKAWALDHHISVIAKKYASYILQ